MYKLMIAATTAFGLVAGFAGSALAAPLQLVSSFDLAQRSGSNALGLNGATVTLTMIFDEGTVFTRDGFATPRVVASSATFDISGAAADTNGTYTPNFTVGLFSTGLPGAPNPTADGLRYSTSNTNVFLPGGDGSFIAIGKDGTTLANQVRIDAGGTVGPARLGDLLTLDLLNTVEFGNDVFSVFTKTGSGGFIYDLTNFETTASVVGDVTPVPLPAGLPLLLMASGAFFLVRRKSTDR